MNNKNLTLLTDLYQLTMMQAYFKEKDFNEIVVFDAFYRKNPFKNAYSISAGLEQVIDYIKNLKFTDEDISYLYSLKIFQKDFLEYLKSFKFTGDIYAVPEGSVIFPKEPFIKVIAPIMEAQLIETAILNIMNHQSLIATKASRVVYAASGEMVMEFGLRRAQGPDAGLYGSRASIIGGCTSTSNVLAGRLFNVPVSGTHAHSWIMSFPDELSAFKSYANIYKDPCILLVDTYDTLESGVKNAITVFKELKNSGIKLKTYGIRLDSGDLSYLSKKARVMLDEAGLFDAIISASNDLDENIISSLKLQGAKINAWGVGTNLITSKDNPSFGGVYKLSAIYDSKTNSFIPKIKLSENAEKITNPGNKTLYRIYDSKNNKIIADLICFSDEHFDINKDLLIFDPIETWKKTNLKAGTYKLRNMFVQIFEKGNCVYESPCVLDIQKYCKQELDTLWEESKRFEFPHTPYVDLSPKLWEEKNKLLEKYHLKKYL